MYLDPLIFSNGKTRHLNILWHGSIFLIGLFIINICLFFVDSRTLGDENLWLKPLKFSVSVMLHFMTLAILAGLLKTEQRNGIAWRIWSYLVVCAGLFEVLYILLQAARGRESHFNLTTNFEATMYGLMGLGAVILVATSFYLGLKLFFLYRKNSNDPLLLSSAFGLIIGSLLTLVIAGSLSSKTEVLSVQEMVGAAKVPLFGWYLNGLDLRIPHFFATHAMQILPLYGLWLSRKKIESSNSIKQVKVVCVCYSLVVVGLFVLTFIA